MNKVMEVARADEITGNPYSVAITAPERVHFVKGTCKEESNWWLEVLQIFPRYVQYTVFTVQCTLCVYICINLLEFMYPKGLGFLR